jgi:hypothetical protein
VQYLEVIEHGALSRHSDLRLLIWAKQGDVNHSRFFTKVTDAWAHCERFTATHDLYSSLGLRHVSVVQNAIDQKKSMPRGTESDVHALLGLAMEFDLSGTERTKKNLFDTEAEILGFLGTLPLKPTMTVLSGGGIHTYWLFQGAWAFAAGEREQAKAISTGWHRTVAALAQRTVDPTFSLDRVYRVAGTVNHKYTPPRQVEVAVLDGTRYTPQQFSPYADSSTSAAVAPNGAVAALRHVKDIQTSKEIPQLPTPVANLVALSEDFAEIWHHKVEGRNKWSQSEWDLSLANALHDAGLEATVIATALAVNRFNHGAQVKPASYFARTLAKAGVYESDRPTEPEIPPALDTKGSGVPPPAKDTKRNVRRVREPAARGPQEGEEGDSEAGEDVEAPDVGDNGHRDPEDRERFLAALSQAVGLNISGIEYTDKGQGHEGFSFIFKLHSGAEVPISKMAMVRSSPNWLNTRMMCPQDQIPFRELTKNAWIELISKILVYADNVSIDENRVRMMLMIELSNFLSTARPPDLSARKKLDIEAYANTGSTFYLKGVIYFGLPAFRKWHNMNVGKLDDQVLLNTMKTYRFVRQKLAGRRYWTVPIEQFNELVGGIHGKEASIVGATLEGEDAAWDSSEDSRPVAGGHEGDPN